MIVVNVILPDKSKARGEVDEMAPLVQIKEDIIEAFLGNVSADDYDLVLLPQNNRVSLSKYTLAEHDTLILLSRRESSGKSFNKLD